METDLFLFDLDGTLSGHNGIPVKTQEVLKVLMSKGKKCSVVTGNTILQCRLKFFDQFMPNVPLILECGGRVTDTQGQDLIRHEFRQNNMEALLRYLNQYKDEVVFAGFYPLEGPKFFFYSPEIYPHVVERYAEILDKYTQDLGEFEELMMKKGLVRIALKISAENLALKDDPEFDGTVTSNVGMYELTDKYVSKKTGIEFLASYLKVPLNKVAVFGNGYNDISMFQTEFSVRVKVGQECENLLPLSTHQVQSPEKIADFLEQNFL